MTRDCYNPNLAPSCRSHAGSKSFPCPKCDGPTIVTDSRNSNHKTPKTPSHRLRRRRHCTTCAWRFTTVEMQKQELNLEYNTAMAKVIAILQVKLRELRP